MTGPTAPSTPAYQHTQVGWVMRVFGVVASVLAFGPAAMRAVGQSDSEGAVILFGFLAVFAVWAVSISSLTIEVDAEYVRWSYGFGWPGGMIDRSIIGSAEGIDVNPWFGIGGILRTPTGWLWSVAAGSAVVLRSDGRETMLGTDDSDGLLAALALPEMA